MKILMTGRNGFIGSNLALTLESHGHVVYSLSYRDSFPDVRDEILTFNPQVTIHCGWFGGNNYSQSNDIDQFHKNIPNGIKLIEILKDIKNDHTFIGFGTTFEYGLKNHVVDEEEVETPVDLYGMSKLVFKNYSRLLCEKYNVNWTWIRPCYTYGPGDVKTRLIPKVINNILSSQPLMFDECKSIIDYLYIDDFSNAILKLIDNKSIGVYNVCSGQQYKIKDVILKISELMNYDYRKIIFDPELYSKTSKPQFICADNSKLRYTIDWEPTTKIEVGLSKTIENIKKNRL